MDWQLGDVEELDAWQTLAHLERLCPQGEVPAAVMVSSFGREHLGQRSPQEQALLKAYLVKPFTSAMLAHAVTGVSNRVPALRKPPRTVRVTPKSEKPKPLLGLHLLVVEDNLLNQVFARELLLGAGAQVVIAGNGAQGVAAVADDSHPPFDLVLMDMLMPVMDGCTAARAIRELPGPQQHVPIIAMTANAMASDRTTCLSAGMNDHVGKPFDFAYLVHTILRHTQAVQPKSAVIETEEKKFDRDSAIALMGNDREWYDVVLQAYIDELHRLPEQFDALLVTGDLAAVRRYLQTLKNNSAAVGALYMKQVVLAAESQLDHGDPAVVCNALATSLRQAAQETWQAMSQVVV